MINEYFVIKRSYLKGLLRENKMISWSLKLWGVDHDQYYFFERKDWTIQGLQNGRI